MGAAFHVGKSRQDYATPREFLDAVERRFGKIAIDLAANSHNAATGAWITEEQNSLTIEWNKLAEGQLLWLNPPYSDISPWAKKCYIESSQGARIAFLVPASVGSSWFAEWVDGIARVFFLRPRLSFDGKAPYPKDCMLAVYGPYDYPGYECWKWK